MTTHSEICGTDTLEEIYRRSGAMGVDTVVRGCGRCGAVVVDEDCDGRTSPGAHSAMRFPEICRLLAVRKELMEKCSNDV